MELVELAASAGRTDLDALAALEGQDFAALCIPYPNFLGGFEPVDELTDWAHARGMLVIAACNPTALALLKPPGEWGAKGADIACGEGQPLGIPLSSGGPYFGFLTCRQALVRQMPGRIVGGTVDVEGRPGFTLTLQAREQHIRRSKATSNICTNQGLMVTAATIYLSLLGSEGLRRVAAQCHANTRALVGALTGIGGVSAPFVAVLPRGRADAAAARGAGAAAAGGGRHSRRLRSLRRFSRARPRTAGLRHGVADARRTSQPTGAHSPACLAWRWRRDA